MDSDLNYGTPTTPPPAPKQQLFTQEETVAITQRSKDIFIASIELTHRALGKRPEGVDEALKLAQISQIFGITLLGIPAQGGNNGK